LSREAVILVVDSCGAGLLHQLRQDFSKNVGQLSSSAVPRPCTVDLLVRGSAFVGDGCFMPFVLAADFLHDLKFDEDALYKERAAPLAPCTLPRHIRDQLRQNPIAATSTVRR